MLLTTVIAAFLSLTRLGEQAIAGLHFLLLVLLLWRVLYSRRRPGTTCRRQIQMRYSSQQMAFDISFGVLLPLACFLFDPIVFIRDGLLSKFWIVGYLGAGIQILLLGVWIRGRSRFIRSSLQSDFGAVIACVSGGAMLSGSVFAFLIGVALLPFSLLGLIVLIGALGFTPFFTGFVFLRNGTMALIVGKRRLGRSRAMVYGLCGAVSILGPWILNAVLSGIESPTSGILHI